MKHVYMTIGIPGSGKSTVTASMLRNTNHTIINADDIRYELFGRCDCFDNEAAVWSLVYTRFQNALKSDRITHIGVTNTHITPKTRKRYYELAQGQNVKFTLLIFIPDVDTCMELQKKRDRQVPRDVLERMTKNFYVPEEELAGKTVHYFDSKKFI